MAASAAVLDGSIARLGSQYVLELRAKNCRTGDIIDEEHVQAARKEDVLRSMSQIASKFRTRVGESLSSVEEHDTPWPRLRLGRRRRSRISTARRRFSSEAAAFPA
jgi:hypothetical protein